MKNEFPIPIVLFIFKRRKVLQIIDQIRKIAPLKLYILADYGRSEFEKKECDECRRLVEKAIDWPCEIVRKYAEENIGVYNNIGKGSEWVFQQEKWAIFLEDDNLPELSFFDFCHEMLTKYENDEKILWICGTNYLGHYKSNTSYVFTRHMLPCGWASWSKKFLKYYDGDLKTVEQKNKIKIAKRNYYNLSLFHQYYRSWMGEKEKIRKGIRPLSWDYQMDFSIKSNDLLGICPCFNQIKNVGVDSFSIHGGNDKLNIMNQKFCNMDSFPLSFPLIHPTNVCVNKDFERKIAKIIVVPFKEKLKNDLSYYIRYLFKIPMSTSIKEYLLHGKKN